MKDNTGNKEGGYKTVEIKEKEKTVDVLSFTNGLSNQEFFIGDEFRINKEFSKETIRFISKSDIYYGEPIKKNLLVKKGDLIPYYNLVRDFTKEYVQGNKVEVTLDLRKSGLKSTNFKPKSINDGEGNYGDNFTLEVCSAYDIQI